VLVIDEKLHNASILMCDTCNKAVNFDSNHCSAGKTWIMECRVNGRWCWTKNSVRNPSTGNFLKTNKMDTKISDCTIQHNV